MVRKLPHFFAVGALIVGFGRAQNSDASPELPPHFTFAEKIQFGEGWEELKQLLPGISKPARFSPPIPDLTYAEQEIEVLGVSFPFQFRFSEGKLSGWSGNAHQLDHETAIGLTDFLVSKLEERFGPSTPTIKLPHETDGHGNQVYIHYLWTVNERELWLAFDFRAPDARVGFGSGRTISWSGNYFVGEPDKPGRGLLCGRHQLEPEEFLIVESPNARERFHVLKRLHECGVTGKTPRPARDFADFGQTLDLHGGKSLTRGEDGRRTFRLEWFRETFPLTIWRGAGEARYAEVHQSMKSLFPEGIEFEGEQLDLTIFED
ncbi:MAG: hypothetical protein ACI8UO_003049 [Verrucomicrobiales bacterium]|jgi:hypothetical protein